MSTTEKFCNPDLETHHTLALWAAACAEHTLHLFEAKQPNDSRPRRALECLAQWVRGERTMLEYRAAAFAAHAAAREAHDPATVAAARATGQAAAVAYMYTHARYAEDYAAKAASLAALSGLATAPKKSEREWQWAQLREELRAIGFPAGL